MHTTINGIAYDTSVSVAIQKRPETARQIGHCTMTTLYRSDAGYFFYSITGSRRALASPGSTGCEETITPITDAQAAAWLRAQISAPADMQLAA